MFIFWYVVPHQEVCSASTWVVNWSRLCPTTGCANRRVTEVRRGKKAEKMSMRGFLVCVLHKWEQPQKLMSLIELTSRQYKRMHQQ